MNSEENVAGSLNETISVPALAEVKEVRENTFAKSPNLFSDDKDVDVDVYMVDGVATENPSGPTTTDCTLDLEDRAEIAQIREVVCGVSDPLSIRHCQLDIPTMLSLYEANCEKFGVVLVNPRKRAERMNSTFMK